MLCFGIVCLSKGDRDIACGPGGTVWLSPTALPTVIRRECSVARAPPRVHRREVPHTLARRGGLTPSNSPNALPGRRHQHDCHVNVRDWLLGGACTPPLGSQLSPEPSALMMQPRARVMLARVLCGRCTRAPPRQLPFVSVNAGHPHQQVPV